MKAALVELDVNIKIVAKQMELLKALALIGNYDSFDDFIWEMIRSGVEAELSGDLSVIESYDKLSKIINENRK